MVERWADIEGHPDYQVSDYGRVRSKSRWLINCNGIKRYWKERLLYIFKDGTYDSITIEGEGCWVHILVAKAFVPNPGNKPTVNHDNTNKKNNYYENLSWMTRSENMQHAKAAGCLVGTTGINNHCSKLTEAEVIEIREKFDSGMTILQIYNEGAKVSQGALRAIRDRKTWSGL